MYYPSLVGATHPLAASTGEDQTGHVFHRYCATPLPADVRHLDFRHFRGSLRAQLRIAIVARAPDVADRRFELRVASAGCIPIASAQQRAQVVALMGEQAQIKLSFG